MFYHSTDYYFHYRLAELSHNMIFTSFDNYYDIFHEITAISSRQTARSQAITREHTAIVDAIKAKDKAAAREAICYHLMMVRKSLRRENNL